MCQHVLCCLTFCGMSDLKSHLTWLTVNLVTQVYIFPNSGFHKCFFQRKTNMSDLHQAGQESLWDGVTPTNESPTPHSLCYVTRRVKCKLEPVTFRDIYSLILSVTLLFNGPAGLKQTKSELLNGNLRGGESWWDTVSAHLDAPSGLKSFQLRIFLVSLCAALFNMGSWYT